LKQHLIHQEVNNVLNSIGSNVFFRFGKDIECISPKGRKSLHKEWTIWISDASWRITHNEKYVAGSADDPKIMQQGIERFLGKKFLSLEFVSQLLDVVFHFEDGYKITTFLDWNGDHQWSIFLPNKNVFILECLKEEPEMRTEFDGEATQEPIGILLSQLDVKENYQKLQFPWKEVCIKRIIIDDGKLIFVCENQFVFGTDSSVWRLEKGNKYYAGWGDLLFEDKEKVVKDVQKLVGQKIRQIETANFMMDTKVLIGDEYVLKTFSCWREENQWNIYSSPTKTAFSSSIPLENIGMIP
jgi:hypothetical protein